MKNNGARFRSKKNRRGATAAFFAAMLPVALVIACYAINVVYMELARTELQITMDVATRAAGRTLATSGDVHASRDSAVRLMDVNPFANQRMTLRGSNLNFGVSTRYDENERYRFAPGNPPNAVKIEANGTIQVPTLFPTLGIPVLFRPVKSAISTQTSLDIALVVDRSSSMAFGLNDTAGRTPNKPPAGWAPGDPAPLGSRWLLAEDAIQAFLALMETSFQDSKVSLTTFSDNPFIHTPLSTDYDRTRLAMKWYSSSFQGGASNMGWGISSGHMALADRNHARSWATRVMIILTDGFHNIGQSPIAAAKRAADQHITIYTVTFSDEADQSLMRSIAEIGSGRHLHATTGQELADALRDIAHSLPTLITH